MAADVSIVVKAVTGPAISGFKKLGSEIDKSTGKAEKFGKVQARSFGSSARGALNVGAAAGGAAAVGLASYGIKKSLDLNKALTKSFTILDSELQRNQAKNSIRDISKEIGIAETSLAEGGFSIISAGKFDDYKGLLKASAQLAKTTNSEVDQLTAGISTAANIFGMKSEDIADGFFQINKVAQAELPQISEMVGKVGASFKLLGKEGSQFKEMAGLFSALTLLGTNPAEAMTGMSSIMKLSTDQGFAARSIAQPKIRERISPSDGIEQFVRKLSVLTGDELAQLIPDDVAKQQLMKLTANTEKLNYAMTGAADMSGSVAKAMDILGNQASHKLDIAMNQVSIAMTKFGEDLTPILVSDVIPNFIIAVKEATPALIRLAKLFAFMNAGTAVPSTINDIVNLGGIQRINSRNGFGGDPSQGVNQQDIERMAQAQAEGKRFMVYNPSKSWDQQYAEQKKQTAILEATRRDNQ